MSIYNLRCTYIVAMDVFQTPSTLKGHGCDVIIIL